MSTLSSRVVAAALAGAAAVLWLSPAFAHAVCGDRIFPATLAIDDPGVGELLFFFDDIFPDTLGKPIFSGGQP